MGIVADSIKNTLSFLANKVIKPVIAPIAVPIIKTLLEMRNMEGEENVVHDPAQYPGCTLASRSKRYVDCAERRIGKPIGRC